MDPEKLLKKLINNEITREEFETLLEQIEDDQVRAKYDEYLQSLFMDEVNAHFKENVKSEDPSKSKKSGTNYKKYYSIAATLLILASISFYILLIVPEYGEPISKQKANSPNEVPIEIKNTPTKRMFRTRLADGSFVHLNAVSSISYPRQFSKTKREVEISGEAYFDVNRDESRPFLIHVKGHTVEVLGTSFDVKAYEDEDIFSVVVESGSVKVLLNDSKEGSIVLTKDQKLSYSPVTRQFKVIEVRAEDELSWRKGILRFNSTPMREVEKMLERWYGVDVTIQDGSIYKKSLTGIHQNENVKSVLESVTYATGTKYEISNNTIIIKK